MLKGRAIVPNALNWLSQILILVFAPLNGLDSPLDHLCLILNGFIHPQNVKLLVKLSPCDILDGKRPSDLVSRLDISGPDLLLPAKFNPEVDTVESQGPD
jgi:hypothetical protein